MRASFKVSTLVMLVAYGVGICPCVAAQLEVNAPIEEILITGIRDDRSSKGATGLDLTALDTPQSFSEIRTEDMKLFALDSINDALSLIPGLQVERSETNRTKFTTRGFEIKSTQVDGVGMPNNWGIVTGAIDSYGFEKIEVIRGANGLLTGVGNGSGTINYVRKRPSNEASGEVRLKVGSYNERRIEGDFSAPVTDDGRWASRWVVAQEKAESYLRGLEDDRAYVYGVVDGQLGASTTLAVGYTMQETHTDGNLWGALVFANSDKTQAEWDVGDSTTQDWTYWDTSRDDAFIEVQHAVAIDWNLKASYNYRNFDSDNQLFYVYSSTGLDPNTGEGLFGWPGKWPSEYEAHFADLSLAGQWQAFGSTHQLLAGVSHSINKNESFQHPASSEEPAFGALPAFPYAGNAVPEPAWGERVLQTTTEQDITRQYFVTQWQFGRLASAILGVNSVKYTRDKNGEEQSEDETSPYVGVTTYITDQIAGYASYSDIYQPQDFTDIDGAYLDPSKGVNSELGVKLQLHSALLASAAIFKSEQKGIGTFAGIRDDGQYYYEGQDVKSSGYELEITGQVNDYVSVLFGVTKLTLEDYQGKDSNLWAPRKTLDFSTYCKLPWVPDVTLGLNGQWQSEIENVDGSNGITIKQDSYGVFNLMASWKVNESVSVQANIKNVTDEKYISSMQSSGNGFYGAPLNGSVSIGYVL